MCLAQASDMFQLLSYQSLLAKPLNLARAQFRFNGEPHLNLSLALGSF